MNLYDATIPVFTKFVNNVERWLDKAEAHAKAKKFDVEVLAQSRLAPDQYALIGHVQALCDAAKFCAAKLTGKDAPSHPDTETNLTELRARLRTCRSYLETFKREEFEGALDRRCTSAVLGDKAMRGGDYLDHFALPNFHFHLTTAYAILRHNGVDLGKMDYLGTLPLI